MTLAATATSGEASVGNSPCNKHNSRRFAAGDPARLQLLRPHRHNGSAAGGQSLLGTGPPLRIRRRSLVARPDGAIETQVPAGGQCRPSNTPAPAPLQESP